MVFKLQIGRLKASQQRIKNSIQQLSNPKQKPLSAKDRRKKLAELDTPIVGEQYSDYEENYEVILRWNPKFWPNQKFEYQRLGFKGPSTMHEALDAIQKTADLLARARRPHSETRLLPVEVHAIYRRGAFKDWHTENKHIYGNEFVQKTIAAIKEANEAGLNKTNKNKGLTTFKVR